MILGAAATVETGRARHASREADDQYGDGVAVMGGEVECCEWAPTAVEIAELVVEDSARAGIFLYGAGGSLRSSIVRRSVFAIALDEGADPTIAADNFFEDNERSEVSAGLGLDPAPPIEPLDR